MRSLVLIGGGGHCKSVLDTALRMNYFNEIVITDPYIPAGTMIMGCRVIGNDDMLKEVYSCGYELAFISIGSIKTTALRKKLWQKARDIGFRFPCITDPDAIISDDSHIDNGTYIGKRVVVNAGTYIGSNAIINTGAVIEHDCRIGDFTHVAPGACICGGCDVGAGSFIGANATLIQGIRIRSGGFVGAGKVQSVSEHTV